MKVIAKLLVVTALIASCLIAIHAFFLVRQDVHNAEPGNIKSPPSTTTPVQNESHKPAPAVLKTEVKTEGEPAEQWPRTAPAFIHTYRIDNGQPVTILNETYRHVSVRATSPVRVQFGSCHAPQSVTGTQWDCIGAPSTITIYSETEETEANVRLWY